MRAPQELPATVHAEPVTIPAQRLIFQALFTLELPMPQPDADLPKLLEAGIERGGQLLKRRLFPQAVERADAERVLAQRHGRTVKGSPAVAPRR